MDLVKIGFIGGGPRATSLWMSLFSIPEYEDKIYPQAMVDINPQAAKDWQYKVDTTYNSLDKFLNDDINAVIIGTPPHTHASIAKKCLEAGISVWSEVPMGLNMEEIWSLIDADKANKGRFGKYTLGENYCYFLQPQFIALENSKNKFGDIYYAEGEYTHSVEHYMLEENYLTGKDQEIDPELHTDTTPTWRANFIPITYGHALGPVLYYLNRNIKGVIERPVEVSCMGNMKMQKRFNTDNFQIAMVQTSEETIIKFVIGFVLGHHGRIFYSAWGSGGIFNGKSFQANDHLYVSVPKNERFYPARTEVQAKNLSDEELINFGAPTAQGGHGGSDVLMFHAWLKSLVDGAPLEIDVFRSAEMTAPGILAVESEEKKVHVEIPRFD